MLANSRAAPSYRLYRGRHLTRLAMKLMAHTFVRTSELIEARWSEIDFAGNAGHPGGADEDEDAPHHSVVHSGV